MKDCFCKGNHCGFAWGIFRESGEPARDPEHDGNKAATLGRLSQMGFPVLPGVVWCQVEDPPDDFFLAVAGKIAFPWLLRSSSPDEDADFGSLAGCFESIGPVTDVAGAVMALGRIRSNLDVARRIGSLAGIVPRTPSVLIQPHVSFVCSGTALWPDPSRENTLLVEPVAGSPAPNVSQKEEVIQLVHRVSRDFFGGKPLDLEWGFCPAGKLWLLQVRFLVRSAGEPPDFMRRGTWRLNRHHHPEVLSPLYASVIEKTRLWISLRQGVWQGRLYESLDAPVPNRVGSFPSVPVTGPFLESRRRFHRFLFCFFRFLPDYLARSRPIRSGENCLVAMLRAMHHSPEPRRFMNFVSVFPKRWDPEAPSIADDIGILAKRFHGPVPEPGGLPWEVFAKRVDSREQDDWVFARMIAALRCELLRLARVASCVLPCPEDVFCLHVDEILEGNFPQCRVLETRRLHCQTLARRIPPEWVKNHKPIHEEMPVPMVSGRLTGQCVVAGRAAGLAGGLHHKPDIAVVHSLTPQDIVFLPEVAGLVVERPELTGHAVLIARELGIPAIVGVKDCVRLISPGIRVFLDADAGQVSY